jgi:hypothetical protein
VNGEQQRLVEDEVERLDNIIKASEDWSKAYRKDPKTHDKLIANEAKYSRELRKMFRSIAKKAPNAVDWGQYNSELAKVKASADGRINADLSVKTIVTGSFLDGVNSDFMNISITKIATAIAIGSLAGATIYDIPIGLPSTSDIIQGLATDRVAALIGKTVNRDDTGKVVDIVDNLKAGYKISDGTRDDILSSLKYSISQGEDRSEASARLVDIIGDTSRADTIAQTESVNAYSAGLLDFGDRSEATGKEWQDVGADDVCADNTAMSPIDFGDSFYDSQGAEIDGPVAHPNCRCGMRLLYANEYTPSE